MRFLRRSRTAFAFASLASIAIQIACRKLCAFLYIWLLFRWCACRYCSLPVYFLLWRWPLAIFHRLPLTAGTFLWRYLDITLLRCLSAHFGRRCNDRFCLTPLYCGTRTHHNDHLRISGRGLHRRQMEEPRQCEAKQIRLMLYFFFLPHCRNVLPTFKVYHDNDASLNGLVGIAVFSFATYLYFHKFNLTTYVQPLFGGFLIAYVLRLVTDSEPLLHVSRAFRGFEQIGLSPLTLLGSVLRKNASFDLSSAFSSQRSTSFLSPTSCSAF